MERSLTVTYELSEEEKKDINEMIHKLSDIKKEFIIANCEDAKQKVDDVKDILIAMRDGKPIKIE